MNSHLSTAKRRHAILPALAFLAPNLLGLLVFTLFPLGVSLILAFTNSDLRHQNMFKHASLKWVGLGNFVHLIHSAIFWKFLGNTLFLMMGIPFAIGGSLVLAILLSKNLHGPSRRGHALMIAVMAVLASIAFLACFLAGASPMVLLFVAIGGGIALIGSVAGQSVYRTLMYLPSFTSGVAIFILWKDLYNPETGPINLALAPVLHVVSHVVHHTDPFWFHMGLWLAVTLMAIVVTITIRHLGGMRRNADLGTGAFVIAVSLLAIPALTAWFWLPVQAASILLLIVTLLAIVWQSMPPGETLAIPNPWNHAVGNGLIIALAALIITMIFEGLGIVSFNLPDTASTPLAPPQWLSSYYWAKPSLMIMSLWIAVGSNHMLLFLAGLSGVPQELYEAADLDGASAMDKFWHVTWPMLAPTTFFIFIMSLIGGLQGGWDMALAMTKGGPAGSTTTLSYLIYNEGFQSGRMAYASAVAWVMFILVLLVTLITWKLGNRHADA